MENIEEYNHQEDIRNFQENVANESMYIMREYGINAWWDLNALQSYKEAVMELNILLKVLERMERYEDCAYVRDIIPLFG
jgi:hypothetical protein